MKTDTPKWYVAPNHWGLGDGVILTALARDLYVSSQGQCKLAAPRNWKALWDHNPHAAVEPPTGSRPFRVDLDAHTGIIASRDGRFHGHYMLWVYQRFRQLTGVHVPVLKPHGDIHLSDAEKVPPIRGRYWLIVAGHKLDAPVKGWIPAHWQATVNRLTRHGIRCVQAGARDAADRHCELAGTLDLVGKTPSIRDFFRLIYHADGVICTITGAMHLAAAFRKPCVVIGGGREGWLWEAYADTKGKPFGPAAEPVPVSHRYLHTIGLLPCTGPNGCWTDILKLPGPAHKPLHGPRRQPRQSPGGRKLCLDIVLADEPVPRCMTLITPAHVEAAVLSYYRDGTIPPVTVDQPPELVEDAQFRSRPAAKPPAEPTVTPPRPSKAEKRLAVTSAGLDDPRIGGKVTICVLGFGHHLALLERCIESIRQHTPADRFDLRIALNQPTPPLLRYISKLPPELVTALYVDHGTRRKYTAMREMFWDPKNPITTPYVLWFDDDSWVKDGDWLTQFSQLVARHHDQGGRLYGPKLLHDIAGYMRSEKQKNRNPIDPLPWFRAGPWWRDRPLHINKGARTAPNGHEIVFASGGFWALGLDAIRTGDIPDRRLRHNGGDILIGLQVHQAGFSTIDFCTGKTPVRWSDSPRRGFHEDFPYYRAP